MTHGEINKVIEKIYTAGEDLILNENADQLSDLSKFMLEFVGINPDKDLSNNCFIGVNVKTDTNEELRPISYKERVKNTSYCSNIDEIDRTLPLLMSELRKEGQRDFPAIIFEWSPNKGVTIEPPYKDDMDIKTKGIIEEYFKGATRKDAQGKDKYHFVSHVHKKALDLGDDEGCYVWIRNSDFDARNNGDRLSCVLCITKEWSDLKKLRNHQERFFEFIMLIKSIYVRKLDDQRIREAIRSAKAAIMSRNMSHNIGSHVMSYLKQHLGSVKDIVSDGILADLVENGRVAGNQDDIAENITLPFLMGMGHFISYLQERQDFIATIATDYIPYFASVNFKDSIYDELNPDKRAERHTDRKNGKTDNILLGNIARSEGLGRITKPTELEREANRNQMYDIVLKFRTQFNGNPVDKIDPLDQQIIDQLKQDNDCNKNNSAIREKEINSETCRKTAEGELEEMRKFYFSLPGGITGRQAFFSILENIIRNAAKHGNWRSKKKLELTFDIYTNQPYDKERIPDNDNLEGCRSLRKVLDDFYFSAADADDLYFMTITDNCDFTLPELYKLQQGLKEDYIDRKTGIMLGGNKGLKEMRISANWLRAIYDEEELFQPLDDLPDSKNMSSSDQARLAKDGEWRCIEGNSPKKAPAIYARICCPKDEIGVLGWYLQYIVCFNIPRKVALVSSLFDSNNESEVIKDNQGLYTRLIRNQWRAYTEETFLAERNKSFEFIICDDLSDDKLYNRVRPYATSRVVKMSDIKRLRTSLRWKIFLKKLESDEFFKKGGSGDRFIMGLYRKLSAYSGTEVITIDDSNVRARGSKKIKTTDSDTSQYTEYVYRRHHESDKQFSDYMKQGYGKYVEGITGHNSTDRLVCHELLDDTWFYRHLHAMKQRVAIIDERLFSKITGLEESSFAKEIVDTKDKSALASAQRGVLLFTFIEDPGDKKKYRLIGMQFENGKPIYDEKCRFRCKCTHVATLSWQNSLKVEWSNNNDKNAFYQTFDFISIHQGLLDKMYKAFGIKGSESEKKNKSNLTNAIFNELSIRHNETIINDNNKDDIFLPGLTIHSGRSKPSFEDMPQRLPFIQYAALEHAVLDCKYSLVELLDFARYE